MFILPPRFSSASFWSKKKFPRPIFLFPVVLIHLLRPSTINVSPPSPLRRSDHSPSPPPPSFFHCAAPLTRHILISGSERCFLRSVQRKTGGRDGSSLDSVQARGEAAGVGQLRWQESWWVRWYQGGKGESGLSPLKSNGGLSRIKKLGIGFDLSHYKAFAKVSADWNCGCHIFLRT